MDFNGVWVAVISSAGTGFVGLMTWLGTKASASSKIDQTEITTRGDEWQKILTASQNYSDRQIADQNAKIARQDDQINQQGQKIGCLEGKVQQLEDENQATQTKYWISIGYVRLWRLRHPESIEHIDVPPEIEPDL